jgi:hypothetical protein
MGKDLSLYVVIIILLIGAIYGVRGWSKRRAQPPAPAAVAALQDFAQAMEQENDRLVEAIAGLRRKLDEETLASRLAVARLQDEVERLRRLLENQPTPGPDAVLPPSAFERRSSGEARNAAAAGGDRSRGRGQSTPAANHDEDMQELALSGFASPRYKEAWERIARGESQPAVMQAMRLGRGEVDLIARLVALAEQRRVDP